MIISASRRTDIPALYSDWLLNRLKEGEVLVRNPRFPRRISRVSLKPEDVDGLVLWTKNPGPMVDKLEFLSEYRLLFHITITPYGRNFEPELPEKNVVMENLKKISKLLGKEHVNWRYDPILLSPAYPMEFHIQSFQRMTDSLAGTMDRCIVSFLDEYRSIKTGIDRHNAHRPDRDNRAFILERFSRVAEDAGIKLSTCCEADDSHPGIRNTGCINAEQIEKITGYAVRNIKDQGQRKLCRCIKSVDIGTYGTCTNGCVYCYAAGNPPDSASYHRYDPRSPLLCDTVQKEDEITDTRIHSLKTGQQILGIE